MKATIVKNNNFETIGFEVTVNGRSIFSWGISSMLRSNFQKQINVKDWMTEIFELVKIEGQLKEAREFVRNFFELAIDNKLLGEGQAVNCEKPNEHISRLEEKKLNIIKNII